MFTSIKLQNFAQNIIFFCDPAIFIFHNNVVTDFNQKLLDKLPEELYIYDFINLAEDYDEKR